jgi:hypothetical protein
MTPLEWILGGGLATVLAAAGKLWLDARAQKREDKSSESQRYDQLWAKLEKLQNDVESERDEYRRKFNESEQQRLHEGEVCERRVREARRESQSECDQIREQMRALSNLSFSQRLGRRTSDPPMGETVTLTVPIVPNNQG